MGRIIVTYVIPFLLPILCYSAWVWYRTRYVARHGGEAPRFEKGPWPLLLFAGAVLALAVLAISAFIQGNAADEGVYVPPRVENGKVIPGHIRPREKGGANP
ncbi:MAG: DUF6111 family protein [Rhodospirillaceae bacterium]